VRRTTTKWKGIEESACVLCYHKFAKGVFDFGDLLLKKVLQELGLRISIFKYTAK
jgi:hypothetical protein